jgi:tRNA pseudouridine55 synthase
METLVDKTFDISGIREEDIIAAANTFIGNIQQVPPVYSAKKISGERAYEFARKGIEVTMKARDVVIKEFEISNINLPEINFRVVCSKGTYIRSLVKDLGEKLGNGAYLSKLHRTRIGEMSVDQALSIEKIIDLIMQQKSEFIV